MRDEQVIEALRKTLTQGGTDFQNAVFQVWLKLIDKPDLKSLTIKSDRFLLCQDLFRNCVKQGLNKLVLDVTNLKRLLGSDATAWLNALQVAGNFSRPASHSTKTELLNILQFEISDIVWKEFSHDLQGNTSLQLIRDANQVARHLLNATEGISPAELGSQLFHDSKHIKNKTLQAWTCRILRQLMPPLQNLDDNELLITQGLIPNPTASRVMVYGPFRYTCQGQQRDWIEKLWKQGESACLTGDNLKTLESVSVDRPVLTIENESVFNRMMHEDHGFALVYTAGFPSIAVRKWISALPSELDLFHWGDGDPEGMEIAAIIHAIHPLKLFRCNADALESMKESATELPDTKRKRAEKLAKQEDFPFPEEIRWMLDNNRWLEQEAYGNKNNSRSEQREQEQ